MDWLVRVMDEAPEGMDLDEVLEGFFVQTAPTLMTGLAIVFVVAAIVDVLLFPSEVALILVPVLLVNAAVLGGIRIWIEGRELASAAAQPLAALFGISGVVNASLPALFTGDPLQGVWVVLLVVAAGMLVLPPWILVGVYGGAIGVWTLVVWVNPPAPAWWLMLHAILISLLVGATTHTVRYRELANIAILRHLDQRRAERLEKEVADRKAMEADLRRSRRRLQTILRNLPVILFTVDAEERVTFVGGQGLDDLPVTSEDLVGEKLADLAEWLPMDLQAAIEHSRRALAGESVVAENRVDDRIYEGRYEPLAGDEIVAVVIDVTEQRRAQEREMEMERLAEVNRFKTHLLNSVSHELKTPLTPIRMQLHRLRGGRLGPVTEEQDRSLEMVDRNIRRLGRLVDEVLQVARGEREAASLEIEPVEIPAVVGEMVDAFAIQADEKGVDLQVGEVPETTVPADRDRLVQVLSNLVSNAISYTPGGGEVRLSAEVEEELVRFEVSDTGFGIDAGQMDQIFEPFTRLHDEDSATGTGLGLYICRELVDAHGGRIEVESPGRGEGSTFTVALPREVNDQTSRREDPGPSR